MTCNLNTKMKKAETVKKDRKIRLEKTQITHYQLTKKQKNVFLYYKE
jgi:hypothetical protein